VVFAVAMCHIGGVPSKGMEGGVLGVRCVGSGGSTGQWRSGGRSISGQERSPRFVGARGLASLRVQAGDGAVKVMRYNGESQRGLALSGGVGGTGVRLWYLKLEGCSRARSCSG